MRPHELIDALSLTAEKAYRWVSHLALSMDRYQINSPKRRAAFLAHVWDASHRLERTVVDLRAIPPRRIQALWPGLFATVEQARPFSGSGHSLANHVFANCHGNGSYESGDGFRFRPRGLLPICGRSFYERLSSDLEFDFLGQPDELAEDYWASMSAGWYWSKEGFNQMADNDEMDGITSTIERRNLTAGRPHPSEIRVVYNEALQVLK